LEELFLMGLFRQIFSGSFLKSVFSPVSKIVGTIEWSSFVHGLACSKHIFIRWQCLLWRQLQAQRRSFSSLAIPSGACWSKQSSALAPLSSFETALLEIFFERWQQVIFQVAFPIGLGYEIHPLAYFKDLFEGFETLLLERFFQGSFSRSFWVFKVIFWSTLFRDGDSALVKSSDSWGPRGQTTASTRNLNAVVHKSCTCTCRLVQPQPLLSGFRSWQN